MWERLAGVGCALIVAMPSSSIAAAQAPVRAPSVIVCLVLSSKLAIEPLVAKTVLSEVQTIWKVLGVIIRAVDQPDDSCARIIVVKADHEALAEDLSNDDALGWVPFAAATPVSWCSCASAAPG